MTGATPLGLFIVTFIFVSITPGLCMILSLTLGMSIGVRRTLWMMVGELLGVGLVSVAAVVGVAALTQDYPGAFKVLTCMGGAYLIYVGIRMWQASSAVVLDDPAIGQGAVGARSLALQGFLTAVANPKGWAFTISLLPPFIDYTAALGPQLIVLISVLLTIEFLSLLAYASGGSALRALLQKRGAAQAINRIAGSLLMLVGVWLALTPFLRS